MDKAAESHIPLNLRRWLDEQIERDLTDCAPVGFHGLLTALTGEDVEDNFQRAAPHERDSSLRVVTQEGDSPLRLVSPPNSGKYEARVPS